MERALVIKQVPTGAGPVVSIRCFRATGAVLRPKSGAVQLEQDKKPCDGQECPSYSEFFFQLLVGQRHFLFVTLRL